jgi:glycosyltransferase involved in cell wall biosynthesis
LPGPNLSVWLVNPYGPLPDEGWRDTRYTMMARALEARGHRVTWWTAGFSHFSKKIRSRGWQRRVYKERFEALLVPVPSYERHVGLGRIAFELAFASRFYRRASGESPPDVMVAVNPPQTTSFAAAKLARRMGVPLVVDVMDLWPEAFATLFPAWARPLARKALMPLRQLRRYSLRSAVEATAVCPSYRELVIREAPSLASGGCTTVYFGVDVGRVRSAARGQASELGVSRSKEPGETWIIYAGTLGERYDIVTVLEVARDLAGTTPAVRFLVAGEGPLKRAVLAAAASGSPVEYLGVLGPEALWTLYGSCDIALCPYSEGSTVGIPAKAFDYLAAGLPVIHSLRDDFADMVERHDIGVPYCAGDAASLRGAVVRLARDDGTRRRQRDNALQLAESFDERLQYGRFADVVERAASGRERRVAGAA